MKALENFQMITSTRSLGGRGLGTSSGSPGIE